MTLQQLTNLVRIGELKHEPADQDEFESLIESARIQLLDSEQQHLSLRAQFLLIYSAAHSLASAALRWHGYRSDSRYLVFQCLQLTVGLDTEDWLVLDKCHHARNLHEYSGQFKVTSQMLLQLKDITQRLQTLVEALDN